MSSIPTSPVAGVKFPVTDLTSKAFAYVQTHNTPTVANHVIRSTLFALIIARKVPSYASCDAESIFLATIMHDLGWSSTSSLISKDKRFEVDGANAAREFIHSNAETNGAKWTEQRIQMIWDAIAMHTSPSISLHGQPGVAVVTYGITADFFGPNSPGRVITVDELREVVKAYPRLDFEAELKQITCNLCTQKPETTYDNFVGLFGCRDLPGYREEWEKHQVPEMLDGGLRACKEFEN
jgi:HD superfamily phosphohydrolase YqeK